jgi:hypothetical protein
VGSVVQPTRDASATATLIARHVVIWKGNGRGCHKRSLVWNRWDMTLQRADKWSLGSNPEGSSSKVLDAG